ncbi:Uncharacterized membrane protein YhaH, DUF805 family [Tistlia consotensis]|uniref:Uncharacterized membrane protein YhaH, DUF805 family n=1 Tax=Tistlia consotensis USBA 355 TaxID=560819 RepID=A0A1Y6BB22_9PROT|nr:DUF805 domain-containing protein [Tistlia consotensis]SMF02245.1 Uncharacterized membrane protein YhaH, DUF805 family [Tistlia consotensis USBA 355]SNS26555.1 Uncharacterized membrane protein YhaH, DUF805 family [Tistlia consotensis]
MEAAVRACLQNYATFSGRAARPEFWWWVLALFLASLVLSVIDYLLFGHGRGPISSLFSLAVLLPNLAVGARRLHDGERSGWWLLIGFLPVIGVIVLIVFFVQDGTVGPNRYGADPKGRTPDSVGPQPDPEPTA